MSSVSIGADRNKVTVKVIDAVMGTGKSTWAINQLNEDPGTPWVIVVPTLSEVARYERELERRVFIPTDETGTKLGSFKDAIGEGETVVTTHSLFTLWDEECFTLVRSGGYHLLLDETVTMVEPALLSKADLGLLVGNDCIREREDASSGITYLEAGDNADGYLADKGGRFRSIVSQAQTHHLISLDGVAAVLSMNPEKFRAFQSVKMLTYMFQGSETECWFQLYKLEYEHLQLERNEGGHKLSPHPGCYSGEQFAPFIEVIEDKLLNQIGEKWAALSRNWFKECTPANWDRLRKNLRNVFATRMKAASSQIMWSCPEEYEKRLRQRPYARVAKGERSVNWDEVKADPSKRCCLNFNARATNDYADRTCLAYVLNVYPNQGVSIFFQEQGIQFDQDAFALSTLLQWIFRAKIRVVDKDGNRSKMILYLPSRRMRELLQEYLGQSQALALAA